MPGTTEAKRRMYSAEQRRCKEQWARAEAARQAAAMEEARIQANAVNIAKSLIAAGVPDDEVAERAMKIARELEER